MRPVTTGLAVSAATLLLALAVTNASANRLSVSGKNLRIVYRSLEFTEEEAALGTVRCPVTLEGSFHSGTIAKVRGALIGHLSRASIGAASSCTGGDATVLSETLPWHIAYQSFSGTLPRISSVRLSLIGVAALIHIRQVFEFFCRVRTTVTNPANAEALVEAGGTATNLRPDEVTGIPLFECPSSTGHLAAPAGDGAITVLGSTTKIAITLI